MEQVIVKPVGSFNIILKGKRISPFGSSLELNSEVRALIKDGLIIQIDEKKVTSIPKKANLKKKKELKILKKLPLEK